MWCELYTKSQLDIVLHQTARDRYSYFDWWRAPAACINREYMSNLISPVLTVSDDTPKKISTIGRNDLIIYWKCWFPLLVASVKRRNIKVVTS